MAYAIVKGFRFRFFALIYMQYYKIKHPEFKDRLIVLKEPCDELGRYTVNID